MPDERRFAPDLTYSEWHRVESIARYLTHSEAKSLVYIDADWMEVCPHCYKTLLLVETVHDIGQTRKVGAALRELAKDAGKSAGIVFYTTDAATRFKTSAGTFPDIVQFKYRKLWPEPVVADRLFTPQQWADALLKLRRRHTFYERDECVARRAAS